MMLCFGPPRERKKQPRLVIHCNFPECNGFLPKLSKHIVQNEPECVIDDPSSIFYDPKEKSGFVYTAHAQKQNFSNEAKKYLNTDNNYVLNEANERYIIDNKLLSKVLDHSKSINQSPISSEFDDSLDRTQSLPNTPLRKTDNVFNDHFDNELEFDPIGGIGADNYRHGSYNSNTSHNNDAILSPEYENDVIQIYKSSRQNDIRDFKNELQLYEEELIKEEKNNHIYGHSHIKGYHSDAESVKTYQDSGIYDDDVFIESPKALTSEEYSQVTSHVFGSKKTDQDAQDELEVERYSAFKTPMSSRHNSLESLDSIELNYKFINHEISNTKEGPKINNQPPLLNVQTMSNPPKRNTMHQHQHPQHPASSSLPWKQTNSKYSHVQAKVQSHRKKSDGSSASDRSRKKSPPNIKQQNNSVKQTKQQNSKEQYVKPKVDSLSNLKHMPGGGESRIFKEKLSFRQKAEPRTDTHGIGMYAHLPEEFQEIARRLARQDSQMRKQETQRGRSTSRNRSSSRQSSSSPNSRRGRSRTRRNKRLTPGNSISDIFAAVNASKGHLDSPTKQSTSQNSLSRSSSIRSIPSTPHLSKQHPSTSIRHHNTSKSPSTSPKPSPGRRGLTLNKTSTPLSKSKADKTEKKESSARTLELLSSPVSKLYQFTTQNESFGSPQYTTNSIYQLTSAVR